jgi:hypothetical protein
MSDRHDDDLGRSKAVNELIWEPRHQGAPGETVAGYSCADFRTGFDERKNGGNSVEKFAA